MLPEPHMANEIDREKARARNRAYKARHADKVKEQRERHRREGKTKEWQRRYYVSHRAEILDGQKNIDIENRRRISRESRQRRREALRADPVAWAAYRAAERPKEAQRRAAKAAAKTSHRLIKTPMQRKIHKQLRMALWRSLKRARAGKIARTVVLLGMEMAEFMAYMEEKFLPGMSWDNYGEWEIDHRRPVVSFDLTDPAQQAACFHYSNLQPLWRTDNRRKAAKVAIGDHNATHIQSPIVSFEGEPCSTP